MPSMSTKQLHFMRLVKAYKMGHRLSGLSTEGRNEVAQAAKSMTLKQVQDFMVLKKGAK